MKNTHVVGILATIILLTLAGAGWADAPPSASAATSPATQAKGAGSHGRLPRNVTIYATRDIGGGQQCLVGESDKEGMNEKPVVYLASAEGGFAWHAQIRILKGAYQGRVTHCVASATSLYVLVQIDTDSSQNLNRTLLQVVELNRKSGAVVASKYIDVANVSADHTSWVDEDGTNFQLKGNRLVIRGLSELTSERDYPTGKAPTAFTVEVPVRSRP